MEHKNHALAAFVMANVEHLLDVLQLVKRLDILVEPKGLVPVASVTQNAVPHQAAQQLVRNRITRVEDKLPVLNVIAVVNVALHQVVMLLVEKRITRVEGRPPVQGVTVVENVVLHRVVMLLVEELDILGVETRSHVLNAIAFNLMLYV